MFQKAQEQAHRNMLAKERERRAIIRARHKEMEIEDKNISLIISQIHHRDTLESVL